MVTGASRKATTAAIYQGVLAVEQMMTENTREPQSLSLQVADLEFKIAHQDFTIEKLQQGLYDCHATIETLEKKMKVLSDKFEAFVSGATEIANERPPHY